MTTSLVVITHVVDTYKSLPYYFVVLILNFSEYKHIIE